MDKQRRNFIRKSAMTIAGAVVVPSIVPSSVLGLNGQTPPSDKILMAAIGTGGMGRGDINAFLNIDKVHISCICDVDKMQLQRTTDLIKKRRPSAVPTQYDDYRQLLEDEKFDVATLALPDHWHGIITPAVLDKKVDVYGQKPLARSIEECKAIVDAVDRNESIWQTGSWQRSVGHFRKAVELVQSGAIGDVKYVEVGLPNLNKNVGTPPVTKVSESLDWDMWLGPAPEVPFRGVCHNDWRWIMDYSGGQLTDWAGHHVDIAHWGLGFDNTGPIEIEGKGVYPRTGLYNVPYEFDIYCLYDNGVKMRIANQSKLERGMGTRFFGDNGQWIHVSRSGLWASDPKILDAEITAEVYKSDNHQRNFIECVETRKPTITPVNAAHRSISVALLGEIAMQTEQKIKWDPIKQTIIDNPYAERLLSRPYRAPWEL